MVSSGSIKETYLEQDQIGICQVVAVQPGAIAARLRVKNPLSVSKELGDPLLTKHLCALLGLRLLLLIRSADVDWMMSVVQLIHKSIDESQCNGVEVVEGWFGSRRGQPQTRGEIEEDGGSLRKDKVAVAENWRGVDRRV